MCCRVFSLKLTRNNDPEMIAHLESKDNVQGYIKSLIKADMEKKERGALALEYGSDDTEEEDEDE
jgi:hypothetical protein